MINKLVINEKYNWSTKLKFSLEIVIPKHLENNINISKCLKFNKDEKSVVKQRSHLLPLLDN